MARQGNGRLFSSNQASSRSAGGRGGVGGVVRVTRIVALCVASAGCGEDFLWETSTAPSPKPTAAIPPLGGSASASAAEPPPGALYASCLRGLEADDDPVEVALRLGFTCGPVTGMRPVFEAPLEGAVAEGTPPTTFAIALQNGRCYRLFGAASSGVTDLDVEVRSSRDVLLASDHTEGRIAVVQPDRPFCALEDAQATVVVSARGGHGAFALFVWSH